MSAVIDATVIGLDDFFSGFEEAFTGRRRQALEDAKKRLDVVGYNLKLMGNAIRDVAEGLDLVVSCEVARSSRLEGMIRVDLPPPSAVASNGFKTSVNAVKTLSETLDNAATGLKYGVKGIEWILRIQAALKAPAVKASAEGIEMVSMVALRAAGSGAAAGTSVPVGTVSTWARWAETFNTASTVFASIGAVMGWIINAIEVAEIRAQKGKLDELLARLNTSIETARTMVKTMISAQLEACEAYGLPADGSVTADDGQGRDMRMQTLHDNLRAMADSVTEWQGGGLDSFRKTQNDVVNDIHFISQVLLAAAMKHRQRLETVEMTLKAALASLRDGDSVEEVASTLSVPVAVARGLKGYVEAHPSADPSSVPQLRIRDDGSVEVTASSH